MKEGLYHLSYVSTGCDGLRFEHIQEIVETAQRNNAAVGVTGILLYCNKHFFQILEGEKAAVDEVFRRIQADHRHDNIIQLQRHPVEERHFEKWSMAFKSYNRELQELDHFNLEAFYSHIRDCRCGCQHASLKILADFFDLNG